MTIKCSFCEANYDPADGHTCAGNSEPPRYRRVARDSDVPMPPVELHSYARDLLKVELVKLQDEGAAVADDYEAYRLVHEPMIASLRDALAKI